MKRPCYVSLLVFWNQTTLMEMASGFILSSVCLLVLDNKYNEAIKTNRPFGETKQIRKKIKELVEQLRTLQSENKIIG